MREQPVPLAEEHRGAWRALDAEGEHAALHVVTRLPSKWLVVSGKWQAASRRSRVVSSKQRVVGSEQ